MKKEIHIKLTFHSDDGDRFLGHGVIELLRFMKDNTSLYKSAAAMNLSYSKATRIINRLEGEFKTPILNRSHGGHLRTGSTLTPFAITLIDEWDKMQKKLEDYAIPLAAEFTKSIGIE